MRALPILAATAALAAALPAQWAQPTITTAPASRRDGACAWDQVTTTPNVTGRLIFYGGLTGSPTQISSQTWSFNGAWTQLSTAGVAIPRWGHRMVRNTQNNRLVTFGGRSPTISAFANDTQEYTSSPTGGTWTTVVTANAPSARYLYGLAFDSVRNVVVLFGGRTNTTSLGDTWEYNGTNWAQRTTATSPPPRQDMVLAYDPGLRRTVMFGGFDDNTDTVLGDTWYYDGTDWTQVTPANPPSPRYASEAVFDSVRKRIVLYGGYTGSTLLHDTYEFTGDAWNTVATATAPVASTDALHGYDPVRKKFVVFGGYGGTFSPDTWEYSGANTGFTSHYGEPGLTSAGEATIASNTPRINQPWTLTFGNMPATQEFVLVAAGTSDSTWNSIPLPIDLSVIGLPGAELVASAEVTSIVNTAPEVGLPTNGATWSTSIPNNVAFLNVSLFAQGVLLDFDASTFAFIGTTKGLRAVLGQ